LAGTSRFLLSLISILQNFLRSNRSSHDNTAVKYVQHNIFMDR